MKEVWKEVKGFEDYVISNLGRVVSRQRKVRYTHSVTKKEYFRTTEEKFLKVYINKRTGYKFVQLYKDKKPKTYTIHRLVADNFINNILGNKVVNHIDGNKHNNIATNLEWCSNEYNHEHATRTGLVASGEKISTSKLNYHCVHAIRILIDMGFNHRELSDIFDVSRPTITNILNKKTWNKY